MMHNTLKALLTISFTLGIVVSCADKGITESSYNNTFSVPIQESGLPPNLAIDSIVIHVDESTNNGDVSIYRHKEVGWFVSKPDFTFSVPSSASATLIFKYWVYSNGRIVLSQDRTIGPSNKGGALADPKIISQDTLKVIIEEQNTAETSLTLKTNPDHESCVKQFNPKVIQAIGTDEATFTFTSNSVSKCTFLYWEIDAEGTAQFKDTATSLANTISVNGATGFLIAHFLFPNETVSSTTSGISSSLEVSEQGTSSSETTEQSSSSRGTSAQGTSSHGTSAEETSSSNTIAPSSVATSSSSSGNPIKKLTIDTTVYDITDNDTISYKHMHSGQYVSAWNTLNGVNASWKNGLNASWTITITYDALVDGAKLTPTFKALHSAVTGPSGSFPARLYPVNSAYMLLMANSGEWNGISQTPLNADFTIGTTLNHSFVTAQTPRLPKRLDRGFNFSTYTVSGKMNVAWTTSEGHRSTLCSLTTTSSAILSGNILQSVIDDTLGATNISPNDTALVLTGITSKDGKSMSLYPVNAKAALSSVTLTETQATHSLTDISIARGSKTTVKYLATEEYKNSTGSYMHRILVGSFSLVPTAVSFQSPGTLWAVIPSSLSGFFAFGNKDGKNPHIFSFTEAGVTQDQYTFLDTNAMEYTGGRTLNGGQIIVWGSAVGTRKGSPSHTKQKGVVALYNDKLDLIWSQPVDMVPFDVYPNSPAGFLVAGFESVKLNTVSPSKILFMGPHGEQ